MIIAISCDQVIVSVLDRPGQAPKMVRAQLDVESERVILDSLEYSAIKAYVADREALKKAPTIDADGQLF